MNSAGGTSTGPGAPPSSRDSGDAVAANVVQVVEALQHVGDATAEWHDAVTTTLVTPTSAAPAQLYSIPLLEAETPVEIKAAQVRLGSGARGRYFIRQRQHERLVEEDAVYAFATYEPKPRHPVRTVAFVPASIVDELLPDGWTVVDADRSEQGYRQLAWSRVFDPVDVEHEYEVIA